MTATTTRPSLLRIRRNDGDHHLLLHSHRKQLFLLQMKEDATTSCCIFAMAHHRCCKREGAMVATRITAFLRGEAPACTVGGVVKPRLQLHNCCKWGQRT